MFGRVGRAALAAAGGEPIQVWAILHAYNPQAVAGALAAGIGAAGVASGSTIVHMPDGTQVSALGNAVTGTMEWGRREQRRYFRLPGRVLVLVSATDVLIHEWTLAKGAGRRVAHWQAGTFTAKKVRYVGQLGVRIVLGDGSGAGKAVVMTGRRGVLHRSTRATIDAIIDISTSASS